MKKKGLVFVGASLAAALLVSAVQAQTPTRVRGTITSLDGNTLGVKSRDGQDLRVELDEKVGIGTVRAITLGDLKAGDFVGATAVKRGDGRMVAVELHMLPPTASQGHTPWDLQPGSTMTNALVGTIVKSDGGNEITLNYKDGSQQILVPDGIPIVTTTPADRSALKPGEYVFIVAQRQADGRLTAPRVSVSKDGVRPPQ